MAEQITCQCGANWAPVPSIGKAHNGHRTEPRSVLVPDEDVYGNRRGMVTRQSSHWVQEGPSVPLRRQETDREVRYTWACTCGATMFLVTRRSYLVDCRHGVTPDGQATVCAVAAIRKNPPADLYVNPRYGGACPCCGHQGTHWVTLDKAAPCGAHA